MRKLFPGYYRPTDQEFSEMWQECIFAFDANVLLKIYRYTHETRESFFQILKRLKDRIWIPHQAAYEYQERRLDVISEQLKAYDDIEELLSKPLRRLESRRHPFIDVSKLTQIMEDTIERAKAVLEEARSKHPDLLESDDVREMMTELFEGKVGAPYSEEKSESIYKKAEQRFTQKIPPGYKDASKEGPRRYGDVVLWFQLIDHAKSQKKPLIFITDDRKEDWWLRREGETVGPRPELIQEMSSQAGVSFYVYETDQFINYAQDFLELQDQRAAIEEIREVRRQDEALQRMAELVGQQLAEHFAEEIGRTAQQIAELIRPPRLLAADLMEPFLKQQEELSRAISERTIQTAQQIAELARPPRPLGADIMESFLKQQEQFLRAISERTIQTAQQMVESLRDQQEQMAQAAQQMTQLPASGTAYVGSTDSVRFHLSACAHARRILPENLIRFASRDEAVAKDYVPCGTCKP